MSAKNIETDAVDAPAKAKRQTVAATVSPEMYEKVQDYRWTHRMSVSDIVALALEQFLGN